jgi:hypothetical protein
MSVILFYLVVYTLSFAVVYKQPAIFKPVYWLFKKAGLGEALQCMLCMPMYIGGFISVINLFLLKGLLFSPSVYFYGIPSSWEYYIAFILIDAWSASAVIYLIDQVQVYLESKSFHNE